MKIRIYQINSDRDEHRMMFMSHDRLERFQGSPEVDSKIYDKVYDKEVDCSNLEDVYTMLNINHPSDYRGRSLSVSDVVEVYESDAVPQGFYFCDSVGFRQVAFHPEECGVGKLMNNEPLKAAFDWELGHEIVSLHVGSYAYGDRLYIGMVSYGEDGPEPFADMTVNIPMYSLEANEGFICGDLSKDLLKFIQDNKLGKVLPYTVKSGYGKYAAVAFDLERLKEFDPKGVAEFEKLHGIEAKEPKHKKARSRDPER